jgi:hypothetical protein
MRTSGRGRVRTPGRAEAAWGTYSWPVQSRQRAEWVPSSRLQVQPRENTERGAPFNTAASRDPTSRSKTNAQT